MSKKAEDSITPVSGDDAAEPEVQTKPEPKVPAINLTKARHGSRLILSENAAAVVSEIQHVPHKGEEIEKTIRTDHKYNPRQSGIVGGRQI